MQMERYPGRLIPTYILERGDGVVVVVVGVVVAAVGAAGREGVVKAVADIAAGNCAPVVDVAAVGAPGREGVVKAVGDIAAGNCTVVDAPAGRMGRRVPGTEAVAAIAAGYLKFNNAKTWKILCRN